MTTPPHCSPRAAAAHLDARRVPLRLLQLDVRQIRRQQRRVRRQVPRYRRLVRGAQRGRLPRALGRFADVVGDGGLRAALGGGSAR